MVRHFLAQIAWHSAIRAMTRFSFCQGIGKSKGIGFLETFKNPIYQKIINNPNNSKNNIKSQIRKWKEQKYKFVESLIPTLNKIIIAINSYLFYWKRKIMNNHRKIISLYVVLPPKVWGGFFSEKPFHSNSEWQLGYLTIFLETSIH